MPTYPIDATTCQVVPAENLVAAASSAMTNDLRLELAGEGAPMRDPRLGLPDNMLGIPPVTGTWDIVAVSRSGVPFPSGTTVTLQITHSDGRDPDPVRLIITNAGIGGVATCPLARLRLTESGRVEVSLAEATAETKLSPIGEAARAAARQALQRNATKAQVNMTVVLDDSASMRPWFRSPAIATIIDVLCGIDSLLGTTETLAIALASENTPQLLEPAAAASIPVERALADQPGAVVTVSNLASRKPLVVVSDGIPADWDPALGCVLALVEQSTWNLLAPADTRGIVPIFGHTAKEIVAHLSEPTSPVLSETVTAVVDTLLALQGAAA